MFANAGRRILSDFIMLPRFMFLKRCLKNITSLISIICPITPLFAPYSQSGLKWRMEKVTK